MSTVIKVVQGDTRPPVEVDLVNEYSNAPINLTGATVKMYFRELNTVTLLDTLNGVIINPEAGNVVLPWNPTTLQVPEGTYEGEIEITFIDGTKQSVFNPLIFALREQFDQPV